MTTRLCKYLALLQASLLFLAVRVVENIVHYLSSFHKKEKTISIFTVSCMVPYDGFCGGTVPCVEVF